MRNSSAFKIAVIVTFVCILTLPIGAMLGYFLVGNFSDKDTAHTQEDTVNSLPTVENNEELLAENTEEDPFTYTLSDLKLKNLHLINNASFENGTLELELVKVNPVYCSELWTECRDENRYGFDELYGTETTYTVAADSVFLYPDAYETCELSNPLNDDSIFVHTSYSLEDFYSMFIACRNPEGGAARYLVDATIEDGTIIQLREVDIDRKNNN
ncbi:hypothetical protein KC717_02230 [Candidatus Dojkabacteria bacterium]|uniref:Uncharacterized protein n=1 Tax=Candidatus Dojkabacteria bacterium TaxID=2099670 RepID=A0A955L7K3_9BACT|nr:hypothetical protein [Candidatus Dojkabacteria bacterium]